MAPRKPKTLLSATHKAEKKRLDILKAAGKCFRKTGFHQTSMQEICAETGLGPGAVYRYFSGKEAIIEAMAENDRQQARAVMLRWQENSDPTDALADITRTLAERYATAADAGLMVEVYAEGLRNQRVGRVVKKTESDWLDKLAALLRNGQARGQIDPVLDAAATALFLSAMWDGMVIRLAYHPDGQAEFFDAMLRRLLTRDGKSEKRTKTPAVAAPSCQLEETASAAALDVRQLSLL